MKNLEENILNEFGNRIKQYRISINMTQAELADRCGISLSTLTRTENGYDSKWSTIIKILEEFDLIDNLDVLIPKPALDYKAMFEEKPKRKRASRKSSGTNNDWTWDEDKED